MLKKSYFSFLLLLTALQIYASENLIFPATFLKGCGISAYQNGGERFGKSNWGMFENSHIRFNAKTINGPAIKDNQKIGEAAGFWTHAFDDIQLLKELGCNAFRFSVEWSEIEPIKGEWNEEVLQFYERYCDELLKNNIQPMITLHHFVHPQWFEDEGGFTKQENIQLFKRFCVKVFERLGTKVPFWCTINEPTVVAACGYILGIHPPGKLFQLQKAGEVLHNLLQGHVEVYKTLKQMPGGDKAQIGIVHQLLLFEPYEYQLNALFKKCNIADPLGSLGAKAFNFTFAHKTTKNFLKTGIFSYQVPLIGNLQLPCIGKANKFAFNPDAPHSYDFIGLNFYSKVILGPHPTCYKDQVMTDMEYPLRPELLYEAIKEMAPLGKPIYITENGLADKRDKYRPQFIKDSLQHVHRAVEDGFDVRGYFYWTLMDNFEWNDGFDMKFGLYKTNFKTKKRWLRRGGKVYRDYFVLEE